MLIEPHLGIGVHELKLGQDRLRQVGSWWIKNRSC